MSGGLAFEGLNNASSTPNDILIILNDNNMSIDRSVGGMNHYFHQLHTSSLYNRLRFAASRKLFNWGWLNEDRRKQLIRFNNSLKSLISNQQNVFEGMNIRYFGPSDGHDVIELVHTLRVLKDMKGPKLFIYTPSKAKDSNRRRRRQTSGTHRANSTRRPANAYRRTRATCLHVTKTSSDRPCSNWPG